MPNQIALTVRGPEVAPLRQTLRMDIEHGDGPLAGMPEETP